MALEHFLKSRDRELEKIETLCNHVDTKLDTLDIENVTKFLTDLNDLKSKADKVNADIVRSLGEDAESLKSNNDKYTRIYLLSSAARTKLEKAKEDLEKLVDDKRKIIIENEKKLDEETKKVLKKYTTLIKSLTTRINKVEADLEPFDLEEEHEVGVGELKGMAATLTDVKKKIDQYMEKLLDVVDEESIVYMDLEHLLKKVDRLVVTIGRLQENWNGKKESEGDKKYVPMKEILKKKLAQLHREMHQMFEREQEADTLDAERQVMSKNIDAVLRRGELIKDQAFEMPEEESEELVEGCNLLQGRADELSVNIQMKLGLFVGNSSRSNMKYKDLEPPKFDSNPLGWTTFKGLFQDYVKGQGLSGKQKLQLLLSQVSGHALDLIKLNELTDEGFKKAWDKLVLRYEDVKRLASIHLKTVLDLPPVVNCTAGNLRKLLDPFEQALNQLEVIQPDVEERYSLVMCHMLYRKLDKYTQEEFNKTLQKDDLPDVDKLIKFIEDYAKLKSQDTSTTTTTRDKGKWNKDKKKFERHVVTIDSAETNESSECVACSESHPLWKCPVFKSASVDERWQILKSSKSVCFRCLQNGHYTKNCESKRKCNVKGCTKRENHDGLLHREYVPREQEKKKESQVVTESCVNVNAASLNGKEPVPATALVNITDKSGQQQLCRVMLDTGAMAPCISEECVNRLSLQRDRDDNWKIKGVTGKEQNADKVHLRLKSRISKFELDFNALVVKNTVIVDELTKHQPGDWNQLNDLKLADPDFYKKNKIDVLIGPEYWDEIFMDGSMKIENGPTARRSQFGWIVMGAIKSINYKSKLNEVNVNSVQCSLDQRLRNFWEIENVPTLKKPLTREEKECEKHFDSNYTRDKDGRFCVKLPFKKDCLGQLGESYATAKKRFISMERRIQKNPEIGVELKKCIQEYFDLDQIEEVPPDEIQKEVGSSYYIPYHPVFKTSSSTTKVRFVFDASCKTSTGVSLNDQLMMGPKLQDDLIPIIMRFRTHVVALSADIAKMYRQFLVTPEHRDFQRILFRENPSDPFKILRIKVLMFGTTNSPYLATKCVETLAKLMMEKCPLACEKLLNDLYMDDLLSGANNIQLALELQRQLLEVMKAGCLELRKWISNREELVESVPQEWREIEVPYKFENDDAVKALGIEWHPKLDYFCFSVGEFKDGENWTKRSLLSEIAKLFDPIGWLAPAVVRAKIMMRKAWIETGKSNWDLELSRNLQDEWIKYKVEMDRVKDIRIPRCVVSSSGKYQLHGFSDASEQAYSACVYLRVDDGNNQIRMYLIAAKTRVSPVKTVSIAKLEVCGAVLLCELLEVVHIALNLNISKVFAWTDSTVVLCWLRKEPIEWNVFVANRVSKVQGSSLNLHWLHIEGKNNPADCASRGISPSELVENHLWWNGPSFLSENNFSCELNVDLDGFVPERKIVNQIQVQRKEMDEFEKLIEKCSSLGQLTRITAYCLRVSRWRKRDWKDEELTVVEEEEALRFWVKRIQVEHYGKEICKMKESPPREPSKDLIQLAPFLDLNGILRVGGRLKNSLLNVDSRHPILLPGKSRLSFLILLDIHHRGLHAGPQSMLSTSRQKWWIFRCRQLCKKIVKNCLPCFRMKSEVTHQFMGDLPENRVNPNPPFSRCGVDFAGPILIKMDKSLDRETRKTKTVYRKSYVAVFVCFSTRAVHLELANGLDTKSFMLCFDRFVSRRGCPSEMYSDQGTNFIGAKAELEEVQRFLLSRDWNKTVGSAAKERKIQWKLNPGKAPHFGGLWEAAVKSMKKHLKRTVGSTVLTYSELETVLCKIEAVLNSRPLTQMSTDPNDSSVLTPGHFLIGRPLNALPELDLKEEEVNRLSRWQLVQQMIQLIWKRWSLDYLHLLQNRQKWTNQEDNLKVGDIVLLKEDNVPPLRWPLARIVKVHPGRDGRVRVVTIRCKGEYDKSMKSFKYSEYERPIVKLCKLPFDM